MLCKPESEYLIEIVITLCSISNAVTKADVKFAIFSGFNVFKASFNVLLFSSLACKNRK